MSYLKELIEHGIMLVSCNKKILRLSVGGGVIVFKIIGVQGSEPTPEYK